MAFARSITIYSILWRPTVVRYPGGGFADSYNSYWLQGTGDIDQRVSPIFHGWGVNCQRYDWGIDEFMTFCKSLDIDPHLVTNFSRKSAEEAANWVEYCNSDTNSTYGKLRASNGYPEPYGVKLWELGNEQWNDDTIMTAQYVEYYDAMKAKDSSIVCMVDGNYWADTLNYERIMNLIDNKCQIFGWHWVGVGVPQVPVTNDTIYYNILAVDQNLTKAMDFYRNKIINNGHESFLMHGNTEWWLIYADNNLWLDTAARGETLECGLANGIALQTFMQYPEFFNLATRTVGLTMIRNDTIAGSGEKTIYPSPALYTQAMLRNHSGQYLIDTEVHCKKYNIRWQPGLIWQADSVPMLNIVSTSSDDSLFISVCNRSITDSIETRFSFDSLMTGNKCKVYQLYSNHYLDSNSPSNKFNITPTESEIIFDNKYSFPPHSFTIIAIPFSNRNIFNNIDEKFIAYPNPFQNKVTLTFDDSEDLPISISIYDFSGRKIEDKKISGVSSIEISTESYATGVYYFAVHYPKTVKFGKILKK
jgi:alpha-N-arabinofuranosidase